MESEPKKEIHVVSIASVPMMVSGGVLGLGMVSSYAFHRELVKVGVRVTYLQCSPHAKGYYYKCNGVETIQVRTLNNPGFFLGSKLLRKIFSYPLWMISSFIPVVRVLRKIQRGDEQLVVCGHRAEAAFMASIMSKLVGCPNVSRFYGSLMPFRLGYDKCYPVSSFRRLLGKFRWWEEYVGTLAPANGYALTNDGTYLGEYIEDRKGKNIVYYHEINGIELDWRQYLSSEFNFDRTALLGELFDADNPLVVTACRLEGWKRVDRVLDIAGKTNGLGHPVNFLIIGNGALKEKFLERIKREKLEGRVRIISGLSQDQVIKYTLASDLYLATQDYSNLTNSILEALVLEKPVVTIDVGGIRDVIEPDVNGVLVSCGNVIEEAVDAVVKIITNREFSKRLSKGAASWRDLNARSWEERSKADVELINKVARQFYS